MNEAVFDLANLSVNAAFDAGDRRAAAARATSATLRPRQLARLRLMKVMSEMREGMWAIVQQAISTLDDSTSARTPRAAGTLRRARRSR